jgi:hypothetical protein
MTRTTPLPTFVEKVEPIVRLCHTVIEKHGGQPRSVDVAHPGVYRGGYWFPAAVEPDSEPDYALRILWTLNHACTTPDRDTAMKYAWDAGQLIFDAHVVFKGKKTALHAAFEAGRVRTTQALRRRKGANAWQRAVDERKGLTKRAKMLKIADDEGIQFGSVKKALQRRRARLRKLSSTRKK